MEQTLATLFVLAVSALIVLAYQKGVRDGRRRR
jgi:hypothetical protein